MNEMIMACHSLNNNTRTGLVISLFKCKPLINLIPRMASNFTHLLSCRTIDWSNFLTVKDLYTVKSETFPNCFIPWSFTFALFWYVQLLAYLDRQKLYLPQVIINRNLTWPNRIKAECQFAVVLSGFAADVRG